LAAAAVVTALHAAGVLRGFEYNTRDLRMRWTLPKQGGHPDIVMLYYSEDSLAMIRESFPNDYRDWRDRELIGNLFEGLSGKPSRKHPQKGPGAPPPSVVLYDFFTLCDNAEPTENLQAVLGESPHVYLAVPFSVHTRRLEFAPEPHLKKFALEVESDGSVHIPEYRSVALPIEEISRLVEHVGDVRSFTDEDGVDRRYHLLCRFRGRYYPSFALAALLAREGARTVTLRNRVLGVGKLSIPVDREGAILLRYYRLGSFPEVGAHSVIAGRRAYDKTGEGALLDPHTKQPRVYYDPNRFSGKTVIVGATAPGLMDLRVTPVSRVTPGPDIHAVAIANLLNRDWLRLVSAWWSYALIVFLAMGTALLARYSSAVTGLGATLVLFGIYGGATVFLFQKRWVIDAAPQLLVILLSYAGTGTVNYLIEGRQKQMMKRFLHQQVPPQVAEKFIQSGEDLFARQERKTLTLLFMDFAGFTTLSEKFPDQIVPLVNKYHSTATEEIFRENGTLDKFMGDAIMAFWGDPIEQPDQTVRACRAALSLQRQLLSLAVEAEKQGMPGIRARVGINTGEAVVACVGSRRRYNYTAMGNEVNTASRLEGVNKEFGTSIIISDSSHAGAKDLVEVRELAFIVVKGKTQAVRIFELLGEKGRTDPELLRRARRFEEGLGLFRDRKWREAQRAFADSADGPSKVYQALCDRYALSPPPEDWKGVYVMEHK